jgi:hypothetical protein
MNPPKKVTTRQQAEEQQNALSQQQSQHETEFATVEDMLRHDADHTPVPPSIARRLQESVSQLPPPPPRAWWRKLFGF